MCLKFYAWMLWERKDFSNHSTGFGKTTTFCLFTWWFLSFYHGEITIFTTIWVICSCLFPSTHQTNLSSTYRWIRWLLWAMWAPTISVWVWVTGLNHLWWQDTYPTKPGKEIDKTTRALKHQLGKRGTNEQWTKGPWLFRVYKGDDILRICMGVVLNHYNL